MFHVRDDFKAGDPISAVGAAWFNKVGAFVNGLVGGRGVIVRKNERGPSVIDLAELPPSKETGTPSDKTDTGADDDQQGEEWVWTAGGADGLTVDCYCKVVEDDGWHMFHRCRLTFSRDGLLVKAEGLKGRREIQS